jgi:hypothetical protein
VTHDDVLSRVNAYDPADLLPASDIAADLGHWEWAAWMRLRAAAPGRLVRTGWEPVPGALGRVRGEYVAFAATRGPCGEPWIECFPDYLEPAYRWRGPGAGLWTCLDPWDPDAAGRVEVPPDVRRALEAAAAEAVRRVLG